MIVDVLGLGETVKDYRPSGNTTVGVNDVFKYFPVDYLVLVDPPQRFNEPDRYKTIMESTPKKFLCTKPWPVPNFELIQRAPGRGMLGDLDKPEIYCVSNNSTFTACHHAYKLGAKEIRLYGADFNTHSVLSKPKMLATILNHYGDLKNELKKRGVRLAVSSRASALSSVLPLI
jgi:hypothetical protein